MTVPPPDHQGRYYTDPSESGESYYEDPPDVYAPRSTQRRRSRRRRFWLIAFVVLIGLLVGADRVAAALTEDRLATKIQQSQHLSHKPSVSIGGFPFLTQVISRDFGHATVDIDDFVDRNGVPISHIHADLRGVHVSSSYDRATVDTLTGTATLDYGQVSQLLSRGVSNIGQVTLAQGGAANQVEAGYQVLGVGFTADVAVDVLGGNVLEFRTVKVRTKVSGLAIDTPGFDAKITLNLPFGLQMSSLQATSTGVDISATGTNVALTGSAVSLTS